MTFTYDKRVIESLSGTSLTYNGFTFPPALSISMQIRPVLDSAKRTTKYVEAVFRVEGILTASDSNGTFGTDVYQAFFVQLTKSGGVLNINGMGLGTSGLEFNKDTEVTFGPHPKMISWRPLADQSCYFVWECECTAIRCGEGGGIIEEFIWGATFNIRRDGTTVRTITGHLIVSGERTSNGSALTVYCVDSYRDQIIFPPIINFHRDATWQVSEDKRRLDFTVSDSEIKSDNAYYPQMIEMNVKERLSGGLQQGALVMWDFSLEGRIQPAPGVPRLFAWLAFLTVVQSRISAAPLGTQFTAPDGTSMEVARINPKFVFENEVYGRELTFIYGHTLITDLSSVLLHSGIWRPVEGNWAAWSQSLLNIRDNRGYAGLSVTAADDVIVDYCTGIIPPKNSDSPNIPGLQAQIQNTLEPPCQKVWTHFQNKLRLYRETSTTQIIKYDSEGGDSTKPLQTDNISSNIGGSPTVTGATGIVNHVQERGPSSGFLIMQGQAIRQGEKIPIPRVVSIGGKPAVLYKEEVHPSELLYWTQNKCPVYGAKWHRVYYMPEGMDGKDIELANIPNGVKK